MDIEADYVICPRCGRIIDCRTSERFFIPIEISTRKEESLCPQCLYELDTEEANG